MTLTVDVPEELESRLEEAAQRNGVSKNEFVRIVLEEKLNVKPPKPNFTAKIIATDVPERDFSLTREWLEKHRDEYDGQYVALDGDKLIAADFDAKEVIKKARESGINGLFLGYVEGSNRPPFISGGLWRK